MSNNYHTQLNQQNGMLNEIASTNQLLQHDQQNRPRSANQVPQFNLAEKQTRTAPQWNNYPETTRQDEIQLSDIDPQPRDVNVHLPIERQVEQQIEPPRAINSRTPPHIDQPNQVATSRVPVEYQNLSPQEGKKDFDSPKIKQIPYVQTRPIIKQTDSPIKKYAIEYALIPIVLVGIFILLVHPTTSAYLEKYLPKMSDLKGLAIRGSILAAVYVIIKIIVSQTIEKIDK